jgi:hypothetical protein
MFELDTSSSPSPNEGNTCDNCSFLPLDCHAVPPLGKLACDVTATASDQCESVGIIGSNCPHSSIPIITNNTTKAWISRMAVHFRHYSSRFSHSSP